MMDDGDVNRVVSTTAQNAMHERAIVHGIFSFDVIGERFLLAAAVKADPVKTLIFSVLCFWPRPIIAPPNPANETRTIDSAYIASSETWFSFSFE